MTPDSSASDYIHEAPESEYIAIATVGKPIGLQGWCRLFPFGNTLNELTIPFSLKAGKDIPRLSVEVIELTNDAKGHKGRFNGYNDREEVDTLKNHQLFIAKDQLPEKSPDEYFHFELEGLSVLDSKTNDFVGIVTRVHNYPTTDALEVQKKNGFTFLVPMTREIIMEIDSATGTVLINAEVIDELL